MLAADENAPPGSIINYREQEFGQGIPGTFGPAEEYDETRINEWGKVSPL